MPNPKTPPSTLRRFILTQTSRPRMLAHTRPIILFTLPLGAGGNLMLRSAGGPVSLGKLLIDSKCINLEAGDCAVFPGSVLAGATPLP